MARVIPEGGATARVRATARVAPTILRAPTLGRIIGDFKSRCVVDWLAEIRSRNLDAIGLIWQRNFHERNVRNERELAAIRRYVRDNPAHWPEDPERIER